MVTRYELEALVRERMLFINKHKERLLEAWIAETGFAPSESILIQRDLGNRIEFSVRKKEEGEQ